MSSKTSSRQNFKMFSWRHLEEEVLQTRLEDVLKMSWRQTSCEDVLQILLEEVLKTSSRHLGRQKIVTLKRSSKRLEDFLKNKKCLLGNASATFEAQFIKMLSKTVTELKKCVTYKKVCITIQIIKNTELLVESRSTYAASIIHTQEITSTIVTCFLEYSK